MTLDVNTVLNLSSTTDTLRVQHDENDAVHYGDGWTLQLPRIVDDLYMNILTQGDATIELVNTRPFHNPLRALDTNHDGSISPIDALIVINRIIDKGPGPLDTPTSVTGQTEFFYVDTNKDGFVSPIDVLVVINFLNDPASNREGEGEVLGLHLAAFPPRIEPSPTQLGVPASSRSASRSLQVVALYENGTHHGSVLDGEAPQPHSRRSLELAADYAGVLDEILADDSLFRRDELFELASL